MRTSWPESTTARRTPGGCAALTPSGPLLPPALPRLVPVLPPWPTCAPVGVAAHPAWADDQPSPAGSPSRSQSSVLPQIAGEAGVGERPGRLRSPGVGTGPQRGFFPGVVEGGVMVPPSLGRLSMARSTPPRGLPQGDGQFPNAFPNTGQGSLSMPSSQGRRQEGKARGWGGLCLQDRVCGLSFVGPCVQGCKDSGSLWVRLPCGPLGSPSSWGQPSQDEGPRGTAGDAGPPGLEGEAVRGLLWPMLE